MKILLTADWHFDCNNRLEDFVASANYMVDYAIKNQIKDFIIVGDMYRNWKPSAERQEFHKILARLILCDINVTLVLGNHDVNEKEQTFLQHALSEFVDVGNKQITLVYREPKMLTIGGKKIYVIPHLSKAYLKGRTYIEAFKAALEPTGEADLALSHTLMFDAIEGKGEATDPRGVSLADTKGLLKCPMLMGDIHGHKVVQQDPLVAYISSPERITFNEIDDLKGFVVYEFGDNPHYSFVPLPVRKFFQITMDLNKNEFWFSGVGEAIRAPIESGDRTEILIAIIKAVQDLVKDSVMKLVVTGHKQDLNLINRHAVISQIKACLPYKITKISFDSTDDTVARDTQFTGHLTAQSAFKLWLDKQVYTDKDMNAAVQSAGMEILNEA
jgi:DNA repair exonuclease SbcCD nuclease subunit